MTHVKSAADYDFTAPEVSSCPYDFYAAAREQSPVHPLPQLGGVLLTRFDDVQQAAREPQHFSSHRPSFGAGDADIEAVMKQGYPSVGALVTADPPQHTRIRKLVSRPFTPNNVARHEELVRRVVADLIDDVGDSGEIELMSQFALPFPARVFGQIMGVPAADAPRFSHWADLIAESVSGYLPKERALECAHGLVEMQHYFVDLIEQRRKDPQEDLLTDLVNAREDGERPLEITEMLELIRIFVAGGTESTASLLGSAFFLMLTHPEQAAQVRADHSLIQQMLDESMRLESPVQWNPRVVENEGVSVDGVAIPVGTRVLLGWGSANRDPGAFGEDANAFDIHRTAGSSLAFGHAFHFCLGAPLARLESRIATEELLTRLPGLELAVPAEQIRFVAHGVVRRVETLPLRFDPSAR